MPMNDTPPLPEVAPGAGGPIRNPNINDVLSGRGGRINNHQGNVRFREMVDNLKREYLDPRTKKIEKARIAARLVSSIRRSDPPGRFLKEDSHTGHWIEIGDERAWKKSGQALRESAPEIRAEQQAQLQAAAERAGSVIAGIPPATAVSQKSPQDSSRGGGGRQSSDPPGPRHRPNPPEREGLARKEREMKQQQQQQLLQYEQQLFLQENQFDKGNNQLFEGNYDDELNRLRREYQLQQLIEQFSKREQMISHGNHCENYDDLANYARNQLRQQNQQLMQQHQQKQRGSSAQEIAAAILDEGLLPVDAGFVIPSLRDQQFSQNQLHFHQQCYPVSDNNNYIPHPDEAFNGRQYNPVVSCDKTVSTMSSFEVQSMDMSSLGGFSFNNPSFVNHNMSAMSGLISTSSQVSRSGTSMARNKQSKSSLERKLEKVNNAYRRQQMEEMENYHSQALPTRGGEYAVLQVPTKTSSSNETPQNNCISKQMMSSLNSFGFEDIAEEEHFDEASVKMSNLGLSEMEMTFNSDVLSIRSKTTKARGAPSDVADDHPPAKRKSSSGSNEENKQFASRDLLSDPTVFGSGISSEFPSNRESISSSISSKNPTAFDLDQFNESLRSMDLECRGSVPPDPPSIAGGNVMSSSHEEENRTRPYGNGTSSSAPKRRQKEPTGGSLPSFTAGGGTVGRGGFAADSTAAKNPPNIRRGSISDLAISDPNIVTTEDFGNSMHSFLSHGSDSSWMDHYQSMENVTGNHVWDEASQGSSLSEISAPRMTVAS